MEKPAATHVDEHVDSVIPTSVRLDDDVLARMVQDIDNFAGLTENAAAATAFEKKLTVAQALRMYPKAAFFSVVLSTAIIMEGFDTALLINFMAYPQFQKRFGVPVGDGTYQLTAPWQSGLSAGGQVGQILGLWAAGIAAERWGYKKTMIVSLVLMIGAIFIMFFAQSIEMLLVGEIICGFPWGAFQTLTTTYAADITPVALRPYLTTFVNMSWVIGGLIATGVIRGLVDRTDDDWGWRIPYAIQWVWPVPIIVGILLAPESPWWLVRNDRIEETKRVLRRLVSPEHTDYNIENHIAMMVYTNAHEKSVSAGTSYKDCFRGVDLRRTEVTCCVWLLQVTCGLAFGGNVTYFLEQAGFDPTNAFSFGLGTNGLALLGTLSSWWALRFVGRRTLYLWGLVIMFFILIIVGFLGIPESTPAIGYASGALMMIFVATYDVTVGPVCYCLVAELPSTRLRIKTVALARNVYNIAGIVCTFFNNPILNPTAWNLRGKGGFVWCGFTLGSIVWVYFRLPEPKGLTPGEIDVLFENKVPARKFDKVKADEFRSAGLDPRAGIKKV
ncbi:putative maltose permease [Thozetella sp. PMI_491]|nr:putative maltose permease [Thozetella sp. PMI_491]